MKYLVTCLTKCLAEDFMLGEIFPDVSIRLSDLYVFTILFISDRVQAFIMVGSYVSRKTALIIEQVWFEQVTPNEV